MKAPKLTVNNNNEKSIKMGMKSFVGKRMGKIVKFMGEDLKINKLTVDEVLAIQEKAKNIEGNEQEGFAVLKLVIKSAAEDADDLSDEDFNALPMDELSKLSNEIMKYSGLGGGDAGK